MTHSIRKTAIILTFVGICLVVLFSLQSNNLSAASTKESHSTFADLRDAFAADLLPPEALEPMSATPCVNGFAGQYPCDNVDLAAFMPLNTIGGGSGSDIWGWTDPQTGREYALMGRTNGTSFVDVTDPENPVYLGNLRKHGLAINSSWRDIKTYNNHAFIVQDLSLFASGMQVFDLTQLRNVNNPPVNFSETAYYGFNSAHNIAINEDSGFAYVVGGSTCNSGLSFINIQNPTNPTNAGCFGADGYTHDAQCVNYTGPDPDHQGREICFAANEDTITIVDVTNKNNPVQLSRTGYSGVGYTHQGWLVGNHRFFVFNDELDEQNFGHGTRTRVLNVTDLDNPTLFAVETQSTPAIDHNLYIEDGYVWEANYRAGLRIFNFQADEVGYFDIYPQNDNASFNGAWSVYPFFDSGTVVVSGIEQGLFVLQPDLPTAQSGTWLSDDYQE